MGGIPGRSPARSGPSAGAALQYFTGSKAHNIVLRDRAIQRGFKLNEYGLYRVSDDTLVAGETEEGIYEALGLGLRAARAPREPRRDRGGRGARFLSSSPSRISAAICTCTTATDGRADAWTMARAAREAGLEYIAITDHSKALAMANGLDERRALEHARRIRALNGRDDLDGLESWPASSATSCRRTARSGRRLSRGARHRDRVGPFRAGSG